MKASSSKRVLCMPFVSFSSCQWNLMKTFQIEAIIALITKMVLIFFMRLVKWPKIDVKKCQNLIFCSIKIERLLFLKFLKCLVFFDSYFWPFNKTHEKIIAIFVISAIMASIWNVFIKFRWHDEKLKGVVLPWEWHTYFS